MAEKAKGICTRIEEVAGLMCDNYCKYPEIYTNVPGGEEVLEAKCKECPLMELLG